MNHNHHIDGIPTRADVVKRVWAEARKQWPTHANEEGLIAILAPGDPVFHFEQFRYGSYFVIECDGVVVERSEVTS